MGVRELVILLLGLAIVAVVLRGLYVAIQGRRGQIRMAIDKNIPQGIDLEAMELAELPGGGARTVDRSLQQVIEQNSALDLAQARAEALDLGEAAAGDVHIPVLMDAVELGAIKHESPVQINSEIAQATDVEVEETEEDLQEEDYDEGLQGTPTITESYLEGEFDEQPIKEDPDSVLFDYDEEDEEDELAEEASAGSTQGPNSQAIDSLQAVAPDYEEELQDTEEQAYDEAAETSVGDEEHDIAPVSHDEEDYEDYEESAETEPETETEEETPVFDPADKLDDFSMTAGDRIGFNSDAVAQSGLFDEVDELPEEEPKPKRKSLFSFFERKPKPAPVEEPIEEPVQAEPLAAETVAKPAPKPVAEPTPLQEPEPEPISQAEILQTSAITETLPFADEVVVEPEPEQSAEPIDELERVRATAAPEPVQESMEPSEVIVINVMAKRGRVFAGDDLLHLLITAGLKFGDMSIFHKRLSNDSQGPIIFSVANILNPGTFDLNNMEEFTTLGISLFLALPSPINNLDAFEKMLDVAQQIRDTLDGELKDDQRNGMTAQTIEHYRQRVRDFELLCLRTAGARA